MANPVGCFSQRVLRPGRISNQDCVRDCQVSFEKSLQLCDPMRERRLFLCRIRRATSQTLWLPDMAEEATQIKVASCFVDKNHCFRQMLKGTSSRCECDRCNSSDIESLRKKSSEPSFRCGLDPGEFNWRS